MGFYCRFQGFFFSVIQFVDTSYHLVIVGCCSLSATGNLVQFNNKLGLLVSCSPNGDFRIATVFGLCCGVNFLCFGEIVNVNLVHILDNRGYKSLTGSYLSQWVYERVFGYQLEGIYKLVNNILDRIGLLCQSPINQSPDNFIADENKSVGVPGFNRTLFTVLFKNDRAVNDFKRDATVIISKGLVEFSTGRRVSRYYCKYFYYFTF